MIIITDGRFNRPYETMLSDTTYTWSIVIIPTSAGVSMLLERADEIAPVMSLHDGEDWRCTLLSLAVIVASAPATTTRTEMTQYMQGWTELPGTVCALGPDARKHLNFAQKAASALLEDDAQALDPEFSAEVTQGAMEELFGLEHVQETMRRVENTCGMLWAIENYANAQRGRA